MFSFFMKSYIMIIGDNMEVRDIYSQLVNPLDSNDVMDTLITKFADANKDGNDFYTTLIKGSKKDHTYVYAADKRNKLLSGLFNYWKHNITDTPKERYIHANFDEEFLYLRDFLIKLPDQHSEEDIRHIFYKSKDERLINAYEKYSFNKYDNAYFKYFEINSISGYHKPSVEINHRLYINLDCLHNHDFAMKYIKKCEENNIPYEFKIDESGCRDDAVVIYVNDKFLHNTIEIIKEIKSENPDIFIGMKRPPIFCGIIDGWIGYGSEPTCKNPKKSFSSLRSDIIENVFSDEVLKYVENNYKSQIRYNGSIIYFYEYICAIITENILDKLKARYNFWKNDDEKKYAKFDEKKFFDLYGYTYTDLINPRFKNHIYQTLVKDMPRKLLDIINSTSYKVDEFEITLQNNKVEKYSTKYIKQVMYSLTKKISDHDPNFKTRVRSKIDTELEKYGIDKEKFCCDTAYIESLKNIKTTSASQMINRSVSKNVSKLENIKPIEPQKVVDAKSSSMLHTTFIPSDKLINDLNNLLDYEPNKVIPFIYEHSNAYRILLPIVIRKNSEIAKQFYIANIESHPEIQAIYDSVYKGLN